MLQNGTPKETQRRENVTWDAFEGPGAPKIAPGCLTTPIFDDLGCLKPPVFMKKTRFYDGNVLSSFLLFLNRTEVFSSQLSSSAPALRIKPPQRGGLGEAHLDMCGRVHLLMALSTGAAYLVLVGFHLNNYLHNMIPCT